MSDENKPLSGSSHDKVIIFRPDEAAEITDPFATEGTVKLTLNSNGGTILNETLTDGTKLKPLYGSMGSKELK